MISFGWAAGDVSLGAYIQSKLSDREDNHTSPLSAIMAFLYSSYLVTFFILNIAMGNVYDVYKKSDPETIRLMFIYIAGVLFTVCSFIIILSTFIPRGSCACFPDSDSEQIHFKEDRADYITILAEKECHETKKEEELEESSSYEYIPHKPRSESDSSSSFECDFVYVGSR